MVQGEAVYKAAARIQKYGVEAFVKMLGETAIKKRGGKARLLKYYTEKYPEAALRIEAKASYISRSQKSYWKDVKSLSKARDMSVKTTRTLLKKLRTDKSVQVRVIKQGEGWQLVITGLFENTDKNSLYFKQQEEATGHSYVHENQDYEECLDECTREAQAMLGGSGWMLVKILKETWIRYYGREE